MKVHLIVTATGQPVEFFLTPGSLGDVKALELFDFDLPPGSTLYADRAYNDYQAEDELLASAQLELQPMRKKELHTPVSALHPLSTTSLPQKGRDGWQPDRTSAAEEHSRRHCRWL